VTSPAGERCRRVRCAIYTRKSTTEGLDTDYNTLDAQRDGCQHYIQSQAHLGWTVVERRYDDGGFTGGNLDRPALQRLLDDIDRGEVDVVVVYKVDRLSRSLLDFARLMERFEKRATGFVSISQHFDTSTSMGRLMLNVLLSFAQFEREIIAERTRDKVQAARRRGKWTGGTPVLGYAVDHVKHRLRVIDEEAKVVRLVFELYRRTRSLDAVAEALRSRRLKQKRYKTRKGLRRGGGEWTRNAVYTVLRNPLYVGKVRGQGETLHPGEQAAILDEPTFTAAGASLDARTTGRKRQPRSDDYALAGILRCAPCEAPMAPCTVKGRNGRRYRYYRCRAHQRHAKHCPTGLLPADPLPSTPTRRMEWRQGTYSATVTGVDYERGDVGRRRSSWDRRGVVARRTATEINLTHYPPLENLDTRAPAVSITASVSRRGHVFKQWPYLNEELAHATRAHSAALDGEIVCLAAKRPQ
jgi:site-specific DNA recombinase